MNSYLNELYLVLLRPDLEYMDEFEIYLRNIVYRWVVGRCLDFFEDSEAELTFRIIDLPLYPESGEKEDLLEAKGQEIFGNPKESIVRDIQKLNPENPDIVEQPFKVAELIQNICNSLRIIHIKTDTSEQIYFGVEYEEFYMDTLFKTTFIMRCMDFGTREIQPMFLFYPVFEELKANIKAYYDKFKEDKEAQNNADSGEL